MTSELRPARRSTKVDDRATRLEGKDPPLMEEPPLMTDKEVAQAAAKVFEEDLVDHDQVRRDIDTAFPPPSGPPPLLLRLAQVIEALPDVQPEGHNKFFNYKFISDKQVLGLLRPRLSKAGIVIVPETVEEGTYLELTTKAGATSRMTRMLVTFRVMDAYSGETFTGQALGYGDDAGDKGANKAYTAAFKNFLIKLCMIGGERDIEDDETTDKRADEHASSSRPITISKGPKVEGVQQGGRQTSITKPQMNAIDSEVERLGITFEQLQKAAKAVTDEDIESKDGLQKLTFQQAGDLIRALMAASPPEGGTNEDEPVDAAGDA